MPTKVSISLRAQFRQKWCSFVAWLAENRFAAAHAWWIELVERFAKPVQLGGRLVDDPYECIARAAINHLYQTGMKSRLNSVGLYSVLKP
jgi:hypothetical protein